MLGTRSVVSARGYEPARTNRGASARWHFRQAGPPTPRFFECGPVIEREYHWTIRACSFPSFSNRDPFYAPTNAHGAPKNSH
jgi:hypothetical protein